MNIWKMVHDKIACDKVVCAKDGVCVCATQWCMRKIYVTKLYDTDISVKDGVC